MNAGVEILLQRIKDNPDDFQYDVSTDYSSKWNQLLMEALRSDVITEEEKSALKNEITEMGRIRFTEKVMKALAGEDEPSDEGKLFINHPGAIPSGGLTLGAYSNVPTTTTLTSNSLTLGKTQLKEAELKAMIAECKRIKIREQEREKRSKTLYGKLKNYLHNE